MAELSFDCVDIAPDRYGAMPTLVARIRITESDGVRIHCLMLRCQVRIEPQRRTYNDTERERLYDIFGAPEQWGETLRPMQLANVSSMVPGFTGLTHVDLNIPVTFDLEVGFARYFYALESGEVPLLLLFSGTLFVKTETGFQIEQVPWDKEATFRMPAERWRELMNVYFPGEGWLRLSHATLDDLRRFRSERGLPTWDMAIETLLKERRT
jgi:hypothetical protein